MTMIKPIFILSFSLLISFFLSGERLKALNKNDSDIGIIQDIKPAKQKKYVAFSADTEAYFTPRDFEHFQGEYTQQMMFVKNIKFLIHSLLLLTRNILR